MPQPIPRGKGGRARPARKPPGKRPHPRYGTSKLEDFFAEVLLEAVKEFLRLRAVFDERIALTDRAPMNAFAEVLHIFEMLHPERVENIEVNFALNLAHSFFAKLELLIVIHLLERGER